MDGANWSGFIQDIAKTALNTAVEVKYKAPLEIQKMQLQSFNPLTGMRFIEGSPVPTGAPMMGGMPPIVLIGGAVLVAVLLLK